MQLEINKINEVLNNLKEDVEDLLIEESTKSEDEQSKDIVNALNSTLYNLDESILNLEKITE